MAKLTFY